MHPSALYFGKKFFDTYIKDISEPLNIIEIGSQDVNGSIRDFFVCKDNMVIPPFFGALKSRGHAACAKRCFGV